MVSAAGPDLADDTWLQSGGDLEGIRETIFWGVRRRDFADSSHRFEMNPEWEDSDALAAYVWSLSNGSVLSQGWPAAGLRIDSPREVLSHASACLLPRRILRATGGRIFGS